MHLRGSICLLAAALAACGTPTPEDNPDTATTAQPVWVNGDFEQDPIGLIPPTGWTLSTNLNNGITDTRPNPQTLASLNLQTGGTQLTHVIGGATETQTDPDVGSSGTLRYPKYGQRAVVVNYNTNANGSNKNSNSMRQTMTVGIGDVDPVDDKVHIRFAIAPVLQNPTHVYTQQPYYFVQVQNITKGTTLYQDFNISGQTGVPWKNFTDTSGGPAQYTDWQLVDVAPGNAALAVGDQVELRVVASGCQPGGHWGRVYVDGIGSAVPGLFTWATGPQQANAGTDITYTLNYKNGGTQTTPGTAIDFVTPPNTTYRSNSLGAACTAPAVGGTGTVRCSLGTLAPGATGSYTVTVRVNALTSAGTVITNGNYSIYATGSSPLIGPKVQTTVTALALFADLNIEVTDGVAAVTWGQPVTYTITATNSGPNLTTATVTNTMPPTLTNVSWTCAGSLGSLCVGAGTGNISQGVTLPAGGRVTYTVSANIIAGSGNGQVVNTVSIATTGLTVDPDTTNNTAVDTNAIGTLNALTVTRTQTASAGVVTSNPTAIDCGTTCSATFADTAQVLLTAQPLPGGTFTGWGGACSGTATTCTVSMSVPRNVTAAFVGAPAALSVSSGDNQQAPLSTPFGLPLAVTVVDANGFAVPGVVVTFSAPTTGARATLSAATATTNASGTAQVTATAGTIAGTYTVTATIVGGPAASFSLRNLGTPASVTVSSGNTQSTIVGTPFGDQLAALVRDATGFPLPNVTVAFTPPASGASATGPASATTDASGIARISVSANTIAGSYSVAASAAGAASPALFSLTNVAGAPAVLAIAGGDAQSTTVATDFAQPLSVILTDAFGNPLSGYAIAFDAPGSGPSATLAPPTAITDANGYAETLATANTAAGSYTITATAAGVAPATFLMTQTSGAPALVSVTGGGSQSTTVATAFGAPLRVRVTDAHGNPVGGATVSFNAPASGASAELDTPAAITDANGNASTTATANTVAGAYPVIATIGGATPAAFSLENTPGAAAEVVAESGTPQEATVASAFGAPLRVRVLDAYGNPVPGAVVTFEAPATGASANLSSTTAITGANGRAQIVAAANTVAGAYEITAAAPGAAPASFHLTNRPGAAAVISVYGGDGQSADVTTPFGTALSVRITDVHGNAVPGHTVSFSAPASGASAALSAPLASTGADGRASIIATANTIAGTYQVSASGGFGTVSFTLSNTPGPATTITTLSGDGQSEQVGEEFAAPLIARITDAHGNPVAGIAATAQAPASGASAQLSPTSTTSDPLGRVWFMATANTRIGGYTIAVHAAGIAGPATFALTNRAGPPAQIVVIAGDAQSALVTQAFPTPLEVVVRDAFGNPVQLAQVMFTGPDTGASAELPPVAILTDPDGHAATTATANTIAGTYLVTAAVDGLEAKLSLTNLPEAASTLTAVSGGGQRTTVDTAFAAPLVVAVRDTFGNPVPGQHVAFHVPPGGASAQLSAASAVTGPDGQASVTASANTIAGAYDVTATSGALGAATFAATNTPGAPFAIAVVAGGSPQTAAVDTPFAVALAVRVVDRFGNPTPGATVAFSAPGAGPTAQLSAATDATDANGIATILATAGPIAGSYTVSAGVAGSAAVSTAFSLTNSPGAPGTVSAAGGGAQSAVVDTPFGTALSVLVTDANGNAVPNAVVSFTAPGGGATAVLDASTAATAANGIAQVGVRAGTVTGSYVVTATVAGTMAPATFALTNTPGAPVSIVAGPASTPQAAAVSTGFAFPLVARVTDAFGNAVPGAAVTFAAPAAGPTAVLDATAATADADGWLSVTATAGTAAGSYAVTATITGSGATLTFSLSNVSGPVAVLSAAGGASQQTVVDTDFGAALAIDVRDAFGNPVPNATVSFAAPGAGATAVLSAPSATTNAVGRAFITAHAGTLTGAYQVIATAPNGTAPVAFSLQNLPGPAAAIAAAEGTGPQSAQVNTPFAHPLAVVISDRFGNRVPGALVTFAAPASGATATLSAGSVESGATGRAQVLAVAGTLIGSYQVTASVSGVAATVALSLTNTPSAPAALAVLSGGAQRTLATTSFANKVAVRVLDGLGNPISGAQVEVVLPGHGPSAVLREAIAPSSDTGLVGIALAANAIVGEYSIQVHLPGGIAASVALANDAIPTEITVAAMTEAISIDQPGAVRATVTGRVGTPGGEVEILDETGAVIGTAVLDAGGQAELSVPLRALGGNRFSARYRAQGSYGASHSAAVSIEALEDGGSLSGGSCSAGGGAGWLAVLLALALALRARSRRPVLARRAVIGAAAVVAGATALAPTPALAQEAGARSIGRLHASAADSEWLGADSVGFGGHRRVELEVLTDYAHEPLVAYNADTSQRGVVVEHALVTQLGASVTLLRRFRLAGTVALAPWQRGNDVPFNGMMLPAPRVIAMGDTALSGDARILGAPDGAFRLAAGVRVTLPTGQRLDYMSDGQFAVEPRLMLAGSAGRFEYAATGSAFLREQRTYGGLPFGHELRYAAAAGLRLANRKLLVGPELIGAVGFGEGADQVGTPAEVHIGGHYRVRRDLSLGLAAGMGIANAIGSPEQRVSLSVGWKP